MRYHEPLAWASGSSSFLPKAGQQISELHKSGLQSMFSCAYHLPLTCVHTGRAQDTPALRSILWRLLKRALIAASAGAATGVVALSVAERVHALPPAAPAPYLTLADGRRLAYEVCRVPFFCRIRLYSGRSYPSSDQIGQRCFD